MITARPRAGAPHAAPDSFRDSRRGAAARDGVLHGAVRLEFEQWAGQPYWLVMTGDKTTPGIDGGLLPRRGPAPVEMAAVNAFVCTIDVPDVDASSKRVVELGGTIALPKMPIPTVGWLVYGKDTEGNLFGMMTMDANAK